ncbi:hypothetical protein VNO78_11741 [Psophocarpus tetragonolobus]|uniref:Tyrosinase copper-binding domain-containing protein n=1 Tax=Psophocarpus tetragonolobus TaxID=3891 RepID=A0AAN9SNT0_PSOTE
MASISSLLNLSAPQSLPICASSSSLFPPFQIARQRTKPKRHHASRVACSGDTNRRDILIGLGGLYGATSLSSGLPALGAPLSPPDPTNCVTSTVVTPENGTFKIECCPPAPFTDYVIPSSNNTQFRIRKAAHLVDDEYIAKYKEAIRRMKALPDDDPRSFKQQAAVHCAYCAGGYKQKGFPDKDIDVHESWLFVPFHRWYLYFFERILGSLIGDPTFALPYWNWDHPNGMRMPSIFTTDTTSPLYDPLRDSRHLAAFMDLNFDFDKEDNPHVNPTIKQINDNLATLHREFLLKTDQSDFFGAPYHAGANPHTSFGSLETVHNTIHMWTGVNPATNPKSNGENMGILYSAARDPIFYCHHSNVDRLWNVWTTQLPGGPRSNFTDQDYLETSFFFYDENKNYVRVKVKDCLDSTRLGYDYQRADLPWLNAGGLIKRKSLSRAAPKQAFKVTKTLPTLQFPLTLDSILRTTVNRPKVGANLLEREVLVIELDYDKGQRVRVDVWVNDEGDDDIGPQDAEFGGSFVTLPHHLNQTKVSSSSFRIPLNNLLQDLDATNDESITVTLCPKYGKRPVTIKDIKIERVPLLKF